MSQYFQVLSNACVFYYFLLSEYETVSHCGFNLYFPVDEWCQTHLIFIGHLYVVLGEISIQAPCLKDYLFKFFLYLCCLVVGSLGIFCIYNVDYLFILFPHETSEFCYSSVYLIFVVSCAFGVIFLIQNPEGWLFPFVLWVPIVLGLSFRSVMSSPLYVVWRRDLTSFF